MNWRKVLSWEVALEIIERRGKYYLASNKELKGTTYTAVVGWDVIEDSGDEEIDVVANNKQEARMIVEQVLKTEYEPGGKIKELSPQYAIYL